MKKRFISPLLLSSFLLLSACEVTLSINEDDSETEKTAQPASGQIAAPAPAEKTAETEPAPVKETVQAGHQHVTEPQTQTVSEETAIQKVRHLLNIETSSPYQVVLDHVDEQGNYVVHAFYRVDSSHPFTLGYYSVHPSTAVLTDVITGEVISVERQNILSSAQTSGYVTYNSGTFITSLPESYVVYPFHSLNNQAFRMAAINPGSDRIQFFVYSGPETTMPDVFRLNRSFETLQDEKQDSNVRWYTIEANNGSYIKTFEQTTYADGTQLTVGLVFDTWDTYNQFKPQYLDFKASVKKK